MLDLGLDLGFIQTKGYTKDYIFKFLSMIGNPSAFELEQYKKEKELLDNLIVNFDNETYYVGKKALETDNATICTRTDKTNRSHDKAELFASLGYLYKLTEEREFSIVTGLPITDYKLSNQLIRNMKGTKKFFFGEDKEELNINIKKVLVIPQSAGAYFSYILDDNGKIIKEYAIVAKGMCMVIDVGYKTTDIIVMENGRYKSKYSTTAEYGMKDIHREMIRRILKDYNLKIEFSEADDICRKSNIKISGNIVNIDNIIKSACIPIARALIDHINLYISDIKRLDCILCCGGTINLLYEYFKKEYRELGNNNVVLLDNPEYSNAVGFYKYGMMLNGFFKNKSKTK